MGYVALSRPAAAKGVLAYRISLTGIFKPRMLFSVAHISHFIKLKRQTETGAMAAWFFATAWCTLSCVPSLIDEINSHIA